MLPLVVVAAVAVIYFAIKASQNPRPGIFAAILVWILYAAYELLIVRGVLCDANCNIRADIFVIWPIVWLGTLFGIYTWGEWSRLGKVIAFAIVAWLVFAAGIVVMMYLEERPAQTQQPATTTTPPTGAPNTPNQ